jgi:hypothetical protein
VGLIVMFLTALVAQSGSGAKPADVQGEWSVTFETPREVTVPMTIVQKGQKLTGRVSLDSGEMPLTGTVDGNNVRIVWSTYEGGERIEIAFIGTVERNTMTGIARTKFGDGDLHAQRTSTFK